MSTDDILAALRQAGAHQFDPVHLHYLQVLAKRTNAHQGGGVKTLLEGKLVKALAAFKTRFDEARADASSSVSLASAQYPHAAVVLQQQLADGDFKGIRQHIDTLKNAMASDPLGELVRHITAHSAQALALEAEVSLDGRTRLRPELKTTQYFRATWSKLSSNKRVTQALAQAPKNAGPINAHSLVLRSLAMMREVSPDYLNRFTSYLDTLMGLAQSEPTKPSQTKAIPGSQGSKKSKKLSSSKTATKKTSS
jgi:hypothetical protein